ncbi:unnamed protein product [Schistosoma curassoni]|nr:unnamed protein product [Schistosoma curassoni]
MYPDWFTHMSSIQNMCRSIRTHPFPPRNIRSTLSVITRSWGNNHTTTNTFNTYLPHTLTNTTTTNQSLYTKQHHTQQSQITTYQHHSHFRQQH